MTVAELVVDLERRAALADAEGATAPVANVYRVVIEALRPLANANGNGAAPASPVPDRWLPASGVAELLGTSARWVYDHSDALGAKRLSRRCLRFSEAAVRRYLERRR